MAIYRFKVSFEDYDDIIREIDIKSNQTFEDLHRAIHKSTGYNAELSSSFYVSNDQWLKQDEIAYLPSQRKIDRGGFVTMEKSKLSNFIDDPHQKFYYTYNFDRPYDFHVELIKILLDEEKGKEYPHISKSVGEAPKPFGTATAAIAAEAAAASTDDFDFLNEMDYAPEDADDLEGVEDLNDESEETEEKDDFADDFDDTEGYESDDHSKDDDY